MFLHLECFFKTFEIVGIQKKHKNWFNEYSNVLSVKTKRIFLSKQNISCWVVDKWKTIFQSYQDTFQYTVCSMDLTWKSEGRGWVWSWLCSQWEFLASWNSETKLWNYYSRTTARFFLLVKTNNGLFWNQ